MSSGGRPRRTKGAAGGFRPFPAEDRRCSGTRRGAPHATANRFVEKPSDAVVIGGIGERGEQPPAQSGPLPGMDVMGGIETIAPFSGDPAERPRCFKGQHKIVAASDDVLFQRAAKLAQFGALERPCARGSESLEVEGIIEKPADAEHEDRRLCGQPPKQCCRGSLLVRGQGADGHLDPGSPVPRAGPARKPITNLDLRARPVHRGGRLPASSFERSSPR